MMELLASEKFVAIALICIFILSIITFVIAISLLIRTKRTQEKINTIFRGKKAKDLEDTILFNSQKLKDFDSEIQELFDISNKVNAHSQKSLHKVGMERFNPFRDYTGNQSFALALLNSKDNGVIISSIHTREGTRVYAKEIKEGEPVNNELTEEEKKAIAQAK